MRWIAVLLLTGCTTVNQPMTFSGACNGDEKCQRNRDAETLHYIGQTAAAMEIVCPDMVDIYGSACTY